jgi:hypothetical protein
MQSAYAMFIAQQCKPASGFQGLSSGITILNGMFGVNISSHKGTLDGMDSCLTFRASPIMPYLQSITHHVLEETNRMRYILI